MALFLDRHDLVDTVFENASPQQIMEAHQCDLAEQAKYGVSYITYWWHKGAKTAFCLVEAPSQQAAEAVHRDAHGMLASRIIEVEWQTLEGFLGPISALPPNKVHEDDSFRTILCSEFEDFDASGLRDVDSAGILGVVDDAFKTRGGRRIKETPQGFLACFESTPAALECALSIHRSFVPIASLYQGKPVRARIGIGAGEPVMTSIGLYGDAVAEAVDLCSRARPGEALVSSDIAGLESCRSFEFVRRTGRTDDWLLTGRTDSTSDYQRSVALPTEANGLTRREIEVLQLIAEGKTNLEIAAALFVSHNTVATHVRNLFGKIDASNRAEAASYAIRHGLV